MVIQMINIGLTGWGDHDTLYEDIKQKSDKLSVYAGHFPVVELDACYYAIQPERNIRKWIKDTPDSFKFVVKSHQALTLHADYKDFDETREGLFKKFREMVTPLKEEDRLAMILVQFPPWFNCSTKNINYMRYVFEQLKGFPICVEFRNNTWFTDEMKEHTLSFLTEQGVMHSVCDEPQVGEGSVPFVNRITTRNALVRFHGRNRHGWTKKDMSDQEWRDVRYLYNYNDEELEQLASYVKILDQKAKDVYVLFNNNSGGHAVDNAKRFQEILGIEYEGLAPQQLKLF